MKIKNIESNIRINDKSEYHQPGDVEVVHRKNDHDNDMTINRNKTLNNPRENDKDSENAKDTNNEKQNIKSGPTIMDFIRKMRSENEKRKKTSENDQNKVINENYNCDKCDFTSQDPASLKTHAESLHEGSVHARDVCDNKATKKTRLSTHTQSVQEDSINDKEINNTINIQAKNTFTPPTSTL